MPYITQERREYMQSDGDPSNAGELNFCITWHMLYSDLGDVATAVENEVERYLRFVRELGGQVPRKKNNYQDYNDVLGALTGAEAEYRRRRGVSTSDDYARCFAVSSALCRFYDSVVAPYEDTKIKENGDVYL